MVKAAVITGASAGIGQAVAARFVASGYRVYNLSRRPSPVVGVENHACDLADSAAVSAVLADLVPELAPAGNVCLVHNASQMRKDRADDCDSEDLANVLQTNVVAVNHLNQGLLPVMGAGSSVLYIGSTLSEKAVPGAYSYVVSKHAMVGMMRATCQDLSGREIHTACICPGFTDTEMLRSHLENDPQLLAAVAGLNAFGRLITPDEIAELVTWAHEHPVINGSVLHAHLGQKES